MTKGIEDFLEISPLSDDNKEMNIVPSSSKNILSEKNDIHEKEAEDIRKKALEAFDEIMLLGKNVEPSKSARMFEVAGQMLKTGLEAVNSKAEKQIKVAKLKLEAARLKLNDETLESLNHGKEIIADRNSLLKQLLNQTKSTIIDANTIEDMNKNNNKDKK